MVQYTLSTLTRVIHLHTQLTVSTELHTWQPYFSNTTTKSHMIFGDSELYLNQNYMFYFTMTKIILMSAGTSMEFSVFPLGVILLMAEQFKQ